MDQLTFTPQLGVIIGLLVGMIIGWVIGFFDSNKRSDKKIQAAETNAQIAMREAEKKIEAANQKIAEATPAQIVAPDEPGLLRLKNENGHYALEMDGAPITSALSADGKKRLIELLTAIRPYLEGGLPPQPVSAPAPKPAPVAPTPAPVISPPVVSSAPVEEESPKPVVKSSDKKAMEKLSMIAQIDTILQERLINSSLAKRGIRVSESSEGGVRVFVGLEKFEAVDDVTDPEVKAFIRASIAEWEKKFTPGA